MPAAACTAPCVHARKLARYHCAAADTRVYSTHCDDSKPCTDMYRHVSNTLVYAAQLQLTAVLSLCQPLCSAAPRTQRYLRVSAARTAHCSRHAGRYTRMWAHTLHIHCDCTAEPAYSDAWSQCVLQRCVRGCALRVLTVIQHTVADTRPREAV